MDSFNFVSDLLKVFLSFENIPVDTNYQEYHLTFSIAKRSEKEGNITNVNLYKINPLIAERIKQAYMGNYRHNSDVAEMLCALMEQIDDHDKDCASPDCFHPIYQISCVIKNKLDIWWQEHKERDKNK